MAPTVSGQSLAPPVPPPLPPSSQHQPHPSQSHFKIAEREPGFWEKFQHAHGAFYEASDPGPLRDHLAHQAGPYFFYGTLMDPNMLMEILDLEEEPTLRPAKIAGYSCKLWGQYPALINGPQGSIVEGAVYEVQSEGHAARLAEYETKAYRIVPCDIKFMDGKEPAEVCGTMFRYSGPTLDLDEGDFDLQKWLQRMGRGEVVEKLSSRKHCALEGRS